MTKRQTMQNSWQGGFAMVEVIVSLGVATILMTTMQAILLHTNKLSGITKQELAAVMYAREGVEVAKDLELSDWDAFPDTCAPGYVPDDLHPVIVDNGGADVWNLATGEEALGAYARTVVVLPVYRDSATFPSEIVESPGICDDDTKRVSVTVTWNNGTQDRSVTLESLVFQYSA